MTEQFQRMDSEQREKMKRYMRPLMMMAEEEVDWTTTLSPNFLPKESSWI